MVKKGFKQTEIGLIPEDWEVKKLGSVLHLIYGKGLKESDRISGEFPVYGSNGIVGFHNEYLETSPGIIIGRKGSVGEVNLSRKNFYPIDTTYVVKLSNNNDLFYFYYLLSYLKLSSITSQSAVPGLNREDVYSLLIPLPPKPEQEAIAKVLSDTDTLIEKLEQLIAKKRNIKTGAMQQLLKPKEGWEVKKLGEVCGKITTGKLDANAMKSDGEYRFYTCAKDYFFIDKYAFDDEALLISGNGENVGYVHYYKGKFNAYQRTYVLTGFSLNVHYIKKYLDKFLASRIEVEVNAGNTPYIRMGTLTEMDIYFPIEEIEQTRIVQILSDMDNEIEALEKKLNKYKMLKQGLMQVLLTGKIRLV